MSVYLVQLAGDPDVVEASDIVEAIRIWKAHMKVIDENFDDEPESVTLLNDGDVVRAS
jgi:hypothetical protein